MKLKLFKMLICLIILGGFLNAGYFAPSIFAEEVQQGQTSSATSYHNIPYEDCTKMYDITKENLYYLTIGAVNANRFTIEELQTANGYIIFTTGRNKYLATVAGIDKNHSILKITPCNNLYYFQPGIISNIYKYIDINKDIINQ